MCLGSKRSLMVKRNFSSGISKMLSLLILILNEAVVAPAGNLTLYGPE